MKLLLSVLLLASLAQATTLQLKSGWNLLGSNKDNIEVNTTMADATTVWLYKNGTWSVASPNGTYSQASIASNNLTTFTHISAGDGFWVNIPMDKNVTLDGDVALETDIDVEDGWNLVSVKTNNRIGVDSYLSNPDIRLAWKFGLNGWEGFSTHYTLKRQLQNYFIPELRVLNVGEGFWVYSAKSSNIASPCTGDDKVREILDIIEGFDPTQDSLTTLLYTLKDDLDPTKTNQMVLSALIDIIEIANSPEVQAFIDTNSSLPNLDAFSGDNEVLIELATNVNSAGGTTLMHAMAEKLKAASNTIAIAYTNSDNEICYTDRSGNSFRLNYDDALYIQSNALAAASSLEMFASYSYGDIGTYFKIQEKDINAYSYEYIKAETDPLAMIQQTDFFKINDTARLATAGNYLKDAVSLMSSIDTTKITLVELGIEDISSAIKMKAAFEGNGIYMEDNITRESINLVKLFSSTEYIDREDFNIPSTYTNYQNETVSLDENMTIINASPRYKDSYTYNEVTNYYYNKAQYEIEENSGFENVIQIDVE